MKTHPEHRPPRLAFGQIWNMCFGFLGIQFGFALQTAEVSRIFQTLGAPLDQIPILWVAAPVTGLIVQPIVGYCSDRTWTRLGRRRPYFLGGAILATVALLGMPHASVLWAAAMLLWLMDASINISMEPFRAFVADRLPSVQRPLGYAMQSFFIGIGAVIASVLPWLLAHLGISNEAAAGTIPDTVRFSFYAGGLVLLLAVAWTVWTSPEDPPASPILHEPPAIDEAAIRGATRDGIAWALAGASGTWAVAHYGLQPSLYLLSIALLGYGLALLWLAHTRSRGMLAHVLADLRTMPSTMRQLAWVQLFSWFAMFALWIYATAAVADTYFGSADPTSKVYNEGANWVGVLFAVYNGFAALAALGIAPMARRFGPRVSHAINLALGGVGMLAFLSIGRPEWLLLPMLGIGAAWASILSLPYAMLSDQLPAAKMGVYMGIFNFFIVIPQLVAASVLGALLTLWFDGKPIGALALGGLSLLLAALCTLKVRIARS
ncbi:MAG TPA: MFS transporter [Dyella sp.]|uniref:MFS transporter n=1 Tax=Dyella sp. TaxID=1869338 RepID=UPI002F95C342